MPKKPLTFILNDETKTNSYGFRVANAGIDLSRFKANALMLDYHIAGNAAVIGRWENIRIEGPLLLADAEFDEEDENAKKIKGKVDRGFLKGASMGLGVLNAKWELMDDVPTLTMCELTEASIVSTPSNANALKLYDSTGQELTSDAIQLSISNNPFFIKKDNMAKLSLSVATLLVLGLQNDQLEDAQLVSASVEKLADKLKDAELKLTAETTAKDALQVKLNAIDEAKSTALVDEAITAGKITADKKEYFLSLAKSDFDVCKGILDGIPAKKSLTATGKTVAPASETVKSMDDFEKLNHDQKLAFKAEFPEHYKQIFNV